MSVLTVHYDEKPIYDINIETGFDRLASSFSSLGVTGRRLLVVSDSNVAPYYLEEVKNELSKTGNTVYSFVIPAGEANKNLKTVETIYEYLIINHFDRNDYLVALGGGVVGDMVGYTAATYLRGISFIQVPTTLLAQVDSSIGGKTGVDFNAYKNMIGAFHQPKLVYMNINTLKSCDDRMYLSGMGEVIKHGFIKDKAFYEWIKENADKIKAHDEQALLHMIYTSCDIKRRVVENDPKEKGERALLNFGHTLGHSIEKLTNFTLYHGECVILGCVCALNICLNRGLITKEELDDAVSVFSSFGFPLSVEGISGEDLLRVSKSDKKMDSDKVKFVLLNGIGSSYIDKTVTDEELLAAADTVIR